MAKGHAYKKQHFLPSFYLKAWVDPVTPLRHVPSIWIFEKDGTGAKRKAPEKVFAESNMYTIQTPDGGRDLRIERGLQRLEDKFASIRNLKLGRGRPLSNEDWEYVCAFLAAMHSRTPSTREHWRKQWERPLRMMDDMAERLKTASPQQIRSMQSIAPAGGSDSITHDQVKRLVASPLQMLMPSLIDTQTPLLASMDMAVVETDHPTGFLTSDHPFVLYDTQSHKYPPLFRSPGLLSRTTEILFPISPTQCLFLNRQDRRGTMRADANMLTYINQMQVVHANEKLIACKGKLPSEWLERPAERTADDD